MNNRLIEDCDESAIKELHKISLLLETDPDLIESMSWDELQTEIREQGLNVDRPLLLSTKPPLENCFPDSSSPFTLGRFHGWFVSTPLTWCLGEVQTNESDRRLDFGKRLDCGKRHFDEWVLRLDTPDRTRMGEIRHAWRLLFTSDSTDDFPKYLSFEKCSSNIPQKYNFKALEGTYGLEDLYQNRALRLLEHIHESSVATEVLSKEEQNVERAQEAFEALNSFMFHPWIEQMVYRTSRAAARQFGFTQEDLAEFLIDKLHTELHTVRYPEHTSFSQALEAWSNAVIKNRCRNLLRHLKVVKSHQEYIKHINCGGKRNSVLMHRSVVPTPEQELIEKEEAQQWASRALQLHALVRRIIMEDVILAYRWGQGQNPLQIARETHKPAKTVFRKLGKMQKAVIEAIGIEETEMNKVLIKESLRDLFANLPPPEEGLIEKEEAQEWASRMLEIRAKARRIITEDVILAYRWSEGQKLDQIARETDKSVLFVARKLGKMQKAILKAIGIDQTEENRVLIKEGLRDLFANSLQPLTINIQNVTEQRQYWLAIKRYAVALEIGEGKDSVVLQEF